MFQKTTAIHKLQALKSRKKVVQGGTWGGKTYAIIGILLNKAMSCSSKRITVAAESIPAIKSGALKDFKDIMFEAGYWNYDSFNATDRIYTFPNGSSIEFQGYDSLGKAQASGKRTDLFLNEANYIPLEIADALMIRTTGDIWIDFNPTSKFWVHDEIVPQDDCEMIILNYYDNESTPETIISDFDKRIEKAKVSSYWANWCKVYIDGEIGSLEGVVFENWSTINNIPDEAAYLGAGLDFGFSNDPTALVKVYKYEDEYIFDEVIYRTGLLIGDLNNLLKDYRVSGTIYADSAEPRMIQELNQRGFKVIGAKKGRDSINYGISLLQDKPFKVTARSINLIKELRNYTWSKNKLGENQNKPVDAFNHAIDAMRYFAMMKFRRKRSFVTARASFSSSDNYTSTRNLF